MAIHQFAASIFFIWLRVLLVGIKQAVDVDHDIAHLSVIHGALRGGAPRLFRLLIIGENADDIHGGRINKFERLRVFNATPKNEMQLAHRQRLSLGEMKAATSKEGGNPQSACHRTGG